MTHELLSIVMFEEDGFNVMFICTVHRILLIYIRLLNG